MATPTFGTWALNRALALGSRVAPHLVGSWLGAGRCQRCGGRFADDRCRRCGLKQRPSAREWIALISDGESFDPLPIPVLDTDPLGFVDELPYPEQVRQARVETGLDESVLTGRARLAGRDIVLIVFDFRFFGGSLGVVAGEKIVRAFAAAVDERRPVVMVVASSGARMQEGLPALFQMPRTSAAVSLLRAAALPFVAVLADPTMGAAHASCANLADVLIGERGALMGLAGPRVVAAVTGRPTQGTRAEDLLASGALDAIVARRELREGLASLLRLLDGRARFNQSEGVRLPDPIPPRDRWELLKTIRDPTWPTGVAWLRLLSDHCFEFSGDRVAGDDPALVCAIAEIGSGNVVVLAQDRLVGDGLIGPSGYRKALRVLRVAARLQLPVVSLVDTAGAAVGPDADRGSISHWLAESFTALLELPVPIISLVVGQGTSGGALALSIADRVYMLEQSTFSVISPEGAAAILESDRRSLPELADAQKLTAFDAYTLGLADQVVPSTGVSRRAQVRQVRQLLAADLGALTTLDPARLVAARRQRYLDLTRNLIINGGLGKQAEVEVPVG